MHHILILPDSELAAVAREGDTLCLRFSAIGAEQGLQPGGTVLAGHLLGVRLQLHGAHVRAPALPAQDAHALASYMGRVRDGRLGQGGRWRSRFELAGAVLEGPLDLELELAHHGLLQLHAERLQVDLGTPPRFVESLAC